jgi:hypothetical protein
VVALDSSIRDECKWELDYGPHLPDLNGEHLTLEEVLCSEAEDPSLTAARNLDWQALSSRLDPKTKAALECLCEGKQLKELAARMRVSPSALSAWCRKLGAAIRDFLGPDLLRQI